MTAQADLRARLRAAHLAGTLDPALALLVETQANFRPARERRIIEAVGGALLERETPAPLAADALALALARIDAEPARERGRGAFVDEVQALPEPVRSAAFAALRAREWKYAGPGIRVLPLDGGGAALAELIRIEPGHGVFSHTHRADEYTLVLTGAFHDERGRYEPGDIAHADPSVTHTPRAAPGEVCYNLAVSEGPLVFTGALGVLQRIWPH
jgi:putative transcriptional regulator